MIDWSNAAEWDVEEQKGHLTGCAPTLLLLYNLQRLYHTTRQYEPDEGLQIKAYNLWGHDWNNVRPPSIGPGNDVYVLSQGLEKIKVAPTY